MNAIRSARAALFVALGCGSAASAGAADQALFSAAQAAQPAVVESLRDMVALESGSDDAAGLEKMAAYVEGRLRRLGATVERVPATNGQPPGIVKGTFDGNGKLRVALIAHMDTVYRRGILQSEPYHRDGNRLYGPGIADDKGGIAVVLHSLEILRAAGWKDHARLTVLFNADEEIGSPGSGDVIARHGEDNDVVLSYEPTPAKAMLAEMKMPAAEGVLLQAAGTATAKLVVEGRAAHAGTAPDQGRNALVELAHQLLRTRDIAASVPGAQMNWTVADAGSARNQIPERAEALADVRFSATDVPEKLRAALAARVAEDELVPDTRTTVSLEVMRPMYVAGEKGMELARRAEAIYAEMDGRKLLTFPSTTGGTDAGFAGRSGKAAVLESLGLAGWGYHSRDEYVEIDSIAPRLYLTTRMLIELGRDARARR